MAQAYYRKWRPLDWDAVIGQDHIIRTLKNALAKERIAHAYLFSGPRGTGKTSTARIIAKAVNCLTEDKSTRPCNTCEHCDAINNNRFLDLIEIDAASNTSVDDIRSLREKINFKPTLGTYKVYIIDEVHMLSNAAFNALLKTLEEPPPHAIFVLATTEVHKIPATVLSRCQRHEFRRIPINFIQACLKDIADKEEIKVDTAALTVIARQATGSMRDAVSLLDQLASTGSDVTLSLTKDVLGTSGSESVELLIEAILEKDAGKGIAAIDQALDKGSDPRQFGRQTVDYLRSILMVKMGNSKQLEVEQQEQEKLQSVANRIEMDLLLDGIQAFDRCSQSTNAGWQPGLHLELAVAHLVNAENKSDQKTSLSVQDTTAPKVIQSSNQPKDDSKSKNINHVPEKKTLIKDGSTSTPPEITKVVSQKEGITGDGNLIQNQWKEIRAAAKSISPETAALLNSCRSINVNHGKLELGFSSPIIKSKMENGQNIQNAKQAVKQICGIDIDVHCVVAGYEKPQVPEGVEIDHDGMLGTALSLGGKMTKEDTKIQGKKEDE